MNLDDSLREKQISGGPFEDMSQLSQGLKFAFRRGKNWEALPPESKEALELMASSVAQILTGDPKQAAHWNDIAILARMRSMALGDSLENSVSRLARARTQPLMERVKDELGDA